MARDQFDDHRWDPKYYPATSWQSVKRDRPEPRFEPTDEERSRGVQPLKGRD